MSSRRVGYQPRLIRRSAQRWWADLHSHSYDKTRSHVDAEDVLSPLIGFTKSLPTSKSSILAMCFVRGMVHARTSNIATYPMVKRVVSGNEYKGYY